MARIIQFICCLAAILMIFQSCESPKPPPKKKQKAVSKPSPKPPKAKAETSSRVWPPGREGASEVIISQNLLARNYYVIFDCSGSMARSGCSGNLSKLDAAKAALGKFAQLVPDDANLGLLVFENGKISELVPLGTKNRGQFTKAVNSTRAEGNTPLFSAVRLGYTKLEKRGRSQLGYGEYTLVIVTDGKASEGQDPTKIVYWILNRSPIQIHTIGFCIGTDHSLNMPGRTVYKPADSPEALQSGLEAVLAEAEVFDVSDFSQ